MKTTLDARSLTGLLIGVLFWSGAQAQDAARSASRRSTKLRVSPTRLSETASVTFSENEWIAWVSPARCDANGNVFIVPVPEADPRDSKDKSRPPRYSKQPRDVLRISANGKQTTVFNLASAPILADAKEINTLGFTVTPDGSLLVLVWAPPDALEESDDRIARDAGHHYIVSFKASGQYSSHVRVDEDEIVASGINVFGSGEVLLQGTGPSRRPRIGVMSSMGGALQDLFLTPELNAKDGARRLPEQLRFVARGGDGRIYYVREVGSEVESAVYGISPSGLTERLVRMTRMPPSWQMVDLMAAGNRVAAVYYEEGSQDTGRIWIAVYDLQSGQQSALYGPAAGGAPVCYTISDRRDQFTVLKSKYLVTLSPAL